ncbi:MAG: hypothetical protein HY562_04275 [Ignavibacteriales bacterium]|nr:hypothetical protein [Ignavibacteriales bacterium]
MTGSLRRTGIVVVIAMVLIMGGSGLNDMIIYAPDSARYLARGNSLAAFEGFLDGTSPEPSKYVYHAPLYSILLAPSQFLFPLSVPAAKTFTMLTGVLMVALFFRWLLLSTGLGVAIVATLFLVLNPLTFIYSTQILSDIPFAACFILFFILAEKLDEGERRNKWLEWGFIVTAVAIVFIREAGFTVVVITTAFLLWRKNYKLALKVFLISLSLYFLWYARNELFMATLENPPMRNAEFFWAHLFTDQRASLAEEILARARMNASVYAGLLGRLVLFPEFIQRAYSLVSPDDPLIRPVVLMLRLVRLPMMLGMAALIAYGFFVDRKTKTFPVLVTVLLFYIGVFLTYPTNDVRYLYPFVPVLLRAAAIGWAELFQRYARFLTEAWRRGALTLILVSLVPNGVWMFNAVKNSWMYTISPRVFYEDIDEGRRYPEQFGKPISLAAEWAALRCDSSQLVGSTMKETAFWLKGRPVVDLEPNAVDYKLRDYNVRFVVSRVSRIGINELKDVMAKSSLFDFIPVHREGTLEVVEVRRKKNSPVMSPREPVVSYGARKDSIRQEFVLGLEMLQTERPVEAESLFDRLRRIHGNEADIVFNLGVAKEFAGRLDEAEEELRSFRLLPQAGNQLVRSRSHLEIIWRIRAAESKNLPSEKARGFNVVAINYWELAFRRRSIAMLRRSLEIDSTFFPSLVLHSLYSLEMGDTATSKRFLSKCQSIEPANALVQGLARIFQIADSLHKARSGAERNSHRVALGRTYEAMGLREEAIDHLLDVLKNDASNKSALRLLAEMYEFKQRYAPALNMVNGLLALSPHDTELLKKREALLSRW